MADGENTGSGAPVLDQQTAETLREDSGPPSLAQFLSPDQLNEGNRIYGRQPQEASPPSVHVVPGEDTHTAHTEAARQLRRQKFEHEQDHDSCPFTAIRMSQWFIQLLDRTPRTNPQSFGNIFASFSVSNAFMFYPPPETYSFNKREDGSVVVEENDDEERYGHEEGRNHKDEQKGKHGRRASKRILYEAPPDVDPRKQHGATHGISGLGTYMTPSERRGQFEMVFVPWTNETQCYRIEKNNVVMEKKITVGAPLYPLSFGCPIPCSIIRPSRYMSSHVAIFFHCNGEDVGHSSCMRLQTLANALHVTILVPEYPGYGLFDGSASEASIKGAMERFVQFLLCADASLTPSRLLLIGHSIGGAVAVHIAAYIQDIFERMQAHYATDVVCPGAYAHDLEKQGKPTFFDQYRPSGTRKESDAPHENGAEAAQDPLHWPVHEPAPATEPADSGGDGKSSSEHEPFTDNDAKCELNEDKAADCEEEQDDTKDSSSTSSYAPSDVVKPLSKSNNGRKEKVQPSTGRLGVGCSCGGGRKSSEATSRSNATHCRHNAVGGIILISTFNSLRCVEYVPTFKAKYKMHPTELERRRYQVPRDTVYPAPVEWREDASRPVPPEQMTFPMEELDSPLLYKMSRFISFNRFPTSDVMARLQERYQYFNRTPLLLVHGSEDELISPVHSVALATTVRQCSNGGRTARVFLSLLTDGGHNDLPCIREIRRFYKDEILLPHFRRQQRFLAKLSSLFHSGCERVSPSHSGSATGNSHAPSPVVGRESSWMLSHPHGAESSQHAPLPELHFLSSEPPSARGEAHPLGQVGARAPRHDTHTLSKPASSIFFQPEDAHPTAPNPSDQDVDGARAPGNEAAAEQVSRGSVAGHEAEDPLSMTELRRSGPHARVHSGASSTTHEAEICGPFIYRENSMMSDGVELNGAVGSSLLMTCEQTQASAPGGEGLTPAATAVHISMHPQPDKYDVGSVLVAAVRSSALTKEAAYFLYRRHIYRGCVWRIFTATAFACLGLVFLAIGITHGILCGRSHVEPFLPVDGSVTARDLHYDSRVIGWTAAETFLMFFGAVLRLLSPYYGIFHLSKERLRHPRWSFYLFSACTFACYAAGLGISTIMGFVLSVSSHSRGGVHWAKWSVLPYRRRVWIAYLPRWFMVAAAILNIVILLLTIVKNH